MSAGKTTARRENVYCIVGEGRGGGRLGNININEKCDERVICEEVSARDLYGIANVSTALATGLKYIFPK